MNTGVLGRLPAMARGVSRTLLLASSALIASNLVAAALGFLYWLVAAHLFSVGNVGLASAAIASLSLVASLGIGGANHVGARFLPAAGTRRQVLAVRIQQVTFVLGAGCGLAYLAGSSLYAKPVAQIGLVFASGTALYALFTVQDQVLLGLGRPDWVPIKNGVFGLAKLLLLLLMVQFARLANWESMVWAWLIASGLCTAAVWKLCGKIAAHRDDRHEASPLPVPAAIVRFALANHLGGVLLQLPALIYPVMVLPILGSVAAAHFYTSWMIAGLFFLLSSDLAMAMVAQAARKGASLRPLLLTGLGYALLLTLGGLLFAVVAGRRVLGLFGPSYVDGFPLLQILLLASPVCAVNAFCAGAMRVQHRLLPVVVQGCVGGGLAIFLAWLLAPGMGLPGFGVAFTVAQLMAVVAVLASARVLGTGSARAHRAKEQWEDIREAAPGRTYGSQAEEQ